MSTQSSCKRYFFIVTGSLSAGIGILGIVLPVLPTTPFLLLSAFCFTRGSRRLYNALMRNRIFGSYIRNYLEGRGMSLKNKVFTLSLLWITIICTAWLVTNSLVVRIILGAVLAGVTTHIMLLKVKK
jgi:uncharacterized membrane protein YbaN (DUF454 family)